MFLVMIFVNQINTTVQFTHCKFRVEKYMETVSGLRGWRMTEVCVSHSRGPFNAKQPPLGSRCDFYRCNHTLTMSVLCDIIMFMQSFSARVMESHHYCGLGCSEGVCCFISNNGSKLKSESQTKKQNI